MATRMASRNRRRGAEVVEFALSLPVLLIFLGGIIDFGWFTSHQSDVQAAAAVGARAASRAAPDEAVVVARTQAERTLAQAGIDAEVTARLLALPNGDQGIEVHVTAPYEALWGFVELGAELDAIGVYRLDIQP